MRSVYAAGVTVLLVSAAGAGAQQNYPARPIRLVVPLAPGAGADISARTVATRLGPRVGQQVVVDNRPGAGGNVGTELVARAMPDGYTLLYVSSSYAANPSLYKLSYDPITGFEPVTLVSQQPFVVVVNLGVPARTVKELIALARANPGKLNYLSSGAGGIQHLATELFKNMAQVDIVHVPYRGGSSGLSDLLGGQVHIEFGTIIGSLPIAKNGQLRALAVTTANRSPAAPDLPTLSEAGVPGYEVSGWYAVLAPVGTPRTAIALLNREIVALLQSVDVKQRFANDGSMVVAGTPQQLTDHLRREVDKWARLVKDANIKLER